jgi:DNA mismatch repair ATPase MutS
MTQGDLLSFFEKRQAEFEGEVKLLSRKINRFSNARLLVAFLAIINVYFAFSNPTLFYGLPLWVLVFAILVKNHAQLFAGRSHFENLVRINLLEKKGLTGDHSAFQSGAAFMNAHHPYTYDLDVFGEGSVFQVMNRCNTLSGTKKFADRLANPLSDPDAIHQHQEAIRELADKVDFRQHFQAAGLEIEEQSKDRQQLQDWIREANFLFGRPVYQIVLIAVPVITVALILGWAFVSNTFRPFAILLAAFQWAFLGFHFKRVNAFHDYISRKKNILQKYAHLLDRLQAEQFHSPLMKVLHEQSRQAESRVKKLASLVSAFDARLNSMTSIVVNSVLLYDLQCVYRLEKWKTQNADSLIRWLETVSDTEVICSFGNFAFNNSHFSYPVVSNDISLTAKAMGHPLIPKGECITNDFQLSKRIQSVAIITGANMAGKSTFLRSLGVNMVLALNGAPVFAKEFTFPIIRLRTGMRTADSLKDHQSYFYAELDRLKGIMDDLRRDVPLLILLDEILKGTNSTDKQAGSIALVKQLIPHPCLAVIATHDLALGELEKEFPQHVRNFSFEANIENDQLSFDYTLKPGLAQKMNATFLMKKMGIIPG